MPPHDLPLEAAVLGAALLEARALRKALELLADADIFYQPGHWLIWEAARTVFQAGQQVDMLTVMRQMREAGTLERAGGLVVIHSLTSKVTGGANIEAHIRILQQLYGRRLTMQAGRKLLTMAADDTVDISASPSATSPTPPRLNRLPPTATRPRPCAPPGA
mgnify:FL=1